MRENEHIRQAAKKAKVSLWRVAAEIGVSEPTIIRWLRFPLPEDKEQQIVAAIKKLEREV